MIDIETAAGEIGISAEAYRRLCFLFISAMDDDLQGMLQALETGNKEELSKRAHHIKGASMNLEFMELSRMAEEIQVSALEADSDVLWSDYTDLCTGYCRVKRALEAVL
jgi:HPt (histidine-containing phosphotransfer) domain-containing protein